jgi:hypothetical protein
MPSRSLFGEEEKAAAVKMFDRCIETAGRASVRRRPGYSQQPARYECVCGRRRPASLQ